MRRVLLLAYYYPPSVDAGAKRALGFARFLPAHGWEVEVLTVRDGNYAVVRDAPAATDQPSTLRVDERRFPWAPGRPAGRAESSVASERSPWWRRAAQRLVREWLYVPDAWCGFHGPALAEARRRHREAPFDAVLTTSSPYTLLRTGAALAGDGLPWVADLRDLWLDNHFGYPHRGLRRRLDTALERRWLGRADRVVTVTDGLADQLRARHPAAAVSVVTNGFLDAPGEVTARAAVARAPSETFRIVYTGKIYEGPGSSAEPLFRALARLRETAPAAFGRVRVDIFGRTDSAFSARVEEHSLSDVVRDHGLVSRERAMAEQREADALLCLLAPDQSQVATTKLFDYLAAWRPVLLLGPTDGTAAAILRSTGGGAAFERDDIDAISEWLRAAVDGVAEDPASRADRLPAVLGYGYARLAGDVASLLDDVAG